MSGTVLDIILILTTTQRESTTVTLILQLKDRGSESTVNCFMLHSGTW